MFIGRHHLWLLFVCFEAWLHHVSLADGGTHRLKIRGEGVLREISRWDQAAAMRIDVSSLLVLLAHDELGSLKLHDGVIVEIDRGTLRIHVHIAALLLVVLLSSQVVRILIVGGLLPRLVSGGHLQLHCIAAQLAQHVQRRLFVR